MFRPFWVGWTLTFSPTIWGWRLGGKGREIIATNPCHKLFTTFHKLVLGVKCHKTAKNDEMSRLLPPNNPLEKLSCYTQTIDHAKKFQLYSGQLSHKENLFRHLMTAWFHPTTLTTRTSPNPNKVSHSAGPLPELPSNLPRIIRGQASNRWCFKSPKKKKVGFFHWKS